MRDRRTITIGDENNIMIGVTVWGENCQRIDFKTGQVIAFRESRISEYRGKSLNASSALTDIVIEPNHPRAAQLKKWLSNQGGVGDMKDNMKSLGGDLNNTGESKKDASVTISEMLHLAENNAEVMHGGKAGYYNVNCYLSWIFFDEALQRMMFYLACPTCKRKVMDNNGAYRCENCQMNYENVVPTYNFSMKISDVSGTITCNLLGETGDSIMGINCKEFFDIHQDIEQVKNIRSN